MRSFLFAVLLWAPSLFADDPVAYVNATTAITRSEIDAAVAPRLAKIAAEEEQIRREVLQQLIDGKLLAAEAARRGVTVEKLLELEVTAKAAPASDPSLRRKNERAAREAFLADLASKAGVHIALQPTRIRIETAGRPSIGAAGAPVTIVVFSDFQCPFCREAASALREVQRLDGDGVRLVFRHLPLPAHDRAERAAEAAECAARSGKFWPVHDALFANPQKLSDSDLISYAAAAGIDREAFTQCLGSGAARVAVDADRRPALDAGVEGTPAIFVNGRRVTGSRTVDALRRWIAEEKPQRSKGDPQ